MPDHQELKEIHTFMHPADVYTFLTERLIKLVDVIMALPIMVVCTLCAKVKNMSG